MLNTKTLITITPTQSNYSEDWSNIPKAAEWSILAVLAVWLVREMWRHFAQTDKQNRELYKELLLSSMKNLQETNSKLIDELTENE
jgi:hypothetical protein